MLAKTHALCAHEQALSRESASISDLPPPRHPGYNAGMSEANRPDGGQSTPQGKKRLGIGFWIIVAVAAYVASYPLVKFLLWVIPHPHGLRRAVEFFYLPIYIIRMWFR